MGHRWVMAPGYVIYAFKEGSIRVINQSAKDTDGPRKGHQSQQQKALGQSLETLGGSL